MLDMLRELIHNLINANVVHPPKHGELLDPKLISPQSARSGRSWLHCQLLLSFCHRLVNTKLSLARCTPIAGELRTVVV